MAKLDRSRLSFEDNDVDKGFRIVMGAVIGYIVFIMAVIVTLIVVGIKVLQNIGWL